MFVQELPLDITTGGDTALVLICPPVFPGVEFTRPAPESALKADKLCGCVSGCCWAN